MEQDRDSFYSLKRAAGSKRVQALFGVLITIIGSAYGWMKGFDDAFAKLVDVHALEEKIEKIEKQSTALENAIGETQATAIALETRLVLEQKARADLSDVVGKASEIELKRDIDSWRAVVLREAPNGRVDEYQSAYQRLVDDGKPAADAAYMVLGWGRLARGRR
jgi:hypothetical protein